MLVAGMMAALCLPARAQESLRVHPTLRSGDEWLPYLREEEKPPAPPPPLALPPTAPPERKPGGPPVERVFVREIRVTGSTVFPASELAKVTAPYVNREITAEDLESVRIALTLLYVNRGYVNSGATIPDQAVTDGVITLRVIEGRLARIDVQGTRWFRPGFIRNRIALGAGPPLNVHDLQQRLQLLQQDDRIERVNAELQPGERSGEGVLTVRIEERNPFRAWADFNNHQSPAIGAERLFVGAADRNVTGHGDTLSLAYGWSSGLRPGIDASYQVPVNARDTTVSLRYKKDDFRNVESDFEPLDIRSRSNDYEITVRHPLRKTVTDEIALSLTGERIDNRTFLLGEPFSFSPGAHDGKTVVTALRFAQEWIRRTPSQVVAVRSRFSAGLDLMGATMNSAPLPDGRFFSWLGQFQWARRLGVADIETLFRTDLQLAADPLLPAEQIPVGGRYSVRGYRENQLVKDNALIASFEPRLPLLRGRPAAGVLTLAPFVDFGTAWNTRTSTPPPRTLASTGAGLLWSALWKVPFELRPQLELYWGIPLRDVDTPGGDLQDHGIHFRMLLSAL